MQICSGMSIACSFRRVPVGDALDERDQDVEAGLERAAVLAEVLDHEGGLLRHHDRGARHGDDRQQHDAEHGDEDQVVQGSPPTRCERRAPDPRRLTTRARSPGGSGAAPALRVDQTVPRSSARPSPPGAIASRTTTHSPTTESLTSLPGAAEPLRDAAAEEDRRARRPPPRRSATASRAARRGRRGSGCPPPAPRSRGTPGRSPPATTNSSAASSSVPTRIHPHQGIRAPRARARAATGVCHRWRRAAGLRGGTAPAQGGAFIPLRHRPPRLSTCARGAGRGSSRSWSSTAAPSSPSSPGRGSCCRRSLTLGALAGCAGPQRAAAPALGRLPPRRRERRPPRRSRDPLDPGERGGSGGRARALAHRPGSAASRSSSPRAAPRPPPSATSR